jgi:hypothetical protein
MADDLIALPAETWGAVRDRAEKLLTAAEADGLIGAVLWLTEPAAWTSPRHRSRGINGAAPSRGPV